MNDLLQHVEREATKDLYSSLEPEPERACIVRLGNIGWAGLRIYALVEMPSGWHDEVRVTRTTTYVSATRDDLRRAAKLALQAASEVPGKGNRAALRRVAQAITAQLKRPVTVPDFKPSLRLV